MVGTTGNLENNVCQNGSIRHPNSSVEEKLDEHRQRMGRFNGDPLRVVGVGTGAWGSVFVGILQDSYGHIRDKVQIRMWRRPGRFVDKAMTKNLFEVINSREDVLRKVQFVSD